LDGHQKGEADAHSREALIEKLIQFAFKVHNQDKGRAKIRQP
jgi:hypothetical protein